jgi:acetyltransferase-like isoleucine patch superfamily enzyme
MFASGVTYWKLLCGGAGGVVTKDIPIFSSVAVGSPCKVIKF